MNYVISVVITAAIFIALIIYLGHKVDDKSKVFLSFCVVTIIGGILLYGYGYTKVHSNIWNVVFRTFLAVIDMFGGGNSYSDLKGVPFFQSEIGLVVFWALHFVAVNTMAITILSLLANSMLKDARLMLARHKELVIIYGVNPNSVKLGEEANRSKKTVVVYIDPNPNESMREKLEEEKAFLYSDEKSVHSDIKFLKKLGMNYEKKKVTVYALSRYAEINVRYVYELSEAMEKMKMKKENTSLTMLANMEMDYGDAFEISIKADCHGEKVKNPGFGAVLVLDRAYLAAQVLIQMYPPSKYMSFNSDTALAESNFEVAIIGFGRVGQAVLKALIQNGQFAGSTFRATIVDPNGDKNEGYLQSMNPQMFEKYNIDFLLSSTGEKSFYDYLSDNGKKLKYIVVCVGDIHANSEIATGICTILTKYGSDAQIFQCAYDGVVHHSVPPKTNDTTRDHKKLQVEITSAYAKRYLNAELVDRAGMLINDQYVKSDKIDKIDKFEKWYDAPYFSQMSSRASATFAKSFFYIIKNIKTGEATDQKEIQIEDWSTIDKKIKYLEQNNRDVFENLAKIEHMRWCAFLYTNGYVQMSMEDYRKSKSRKNPLKKEDLRLVDWDDLENVRQWMKEVENEDGDIKENHRGIVRMIPKILQEEVKKNIT